MPGIQGGATRPAPTRAPRPKAPAAAKPKAKRQRPQGTKPTAKPSKPRAAKPQVRAQAGAKKPAAGGAAAPQDKAKTRGANPFGGLFGGGAPKTQDTDKPKATEGGGFGGFLQGLQKKAEGVVGQFQPKLDPQQRAAAEYVRNMLEPNKLGGADRTFNYGDVDAVVRGLMCDTCGLSREVQGQLRQEGKGFQANLVGRALGGGRGPLKRMARNKVYSEAPGRIRGQLQSGLQEAKADPATAGKRDTTPRNITFNEVRQFEQHARVLQKMQQEMTKKLGVDIQFPNGMSQASIQHMLDGKLGFPPGAVVKPLGK